MMIFAHAYTKKKKILTTSKHSVILLESKFYFESPKKPEIVLLTQQNFLRFNKKILSNFINLSENQ